MVVFVYSYRGFGIVNVVPILNSSVAILGLVVSQMGYCWLSFPGRNSVWILFPMLASECSFVSTAAESECNVEIYC